ncbi:hypothetical protein HY489_00610 [Candidatus Woesearchaeota archaeon]|nr:hypothetical protein [Candidatus Woesearchaeota archaeon]
MPEEKQDQGESRTIETLRESLHELKDQKEQLFDKRNNLGRTISQNIGQIKQLKAERNTLTDEVKKLKEQRATITADLRAKITKHKHVIGEKKEVKPTKDPRYLKKQIEAFEYKIQTEVIDFSKEQKMMKVLNELKKEYQHGAKAAGLYEHASSLGGEIAELKKKADSLHAQIQEKAKQSQHKHEQLMKLSKEVDELKKKENELNAQIGNVKKEFNEKVKPLEEHRKRSYTKEQDSRHKEAKQRQKKLSELQHEVMQKLKNKEKLTNQDLLVLQSMDENK